ELGGAGSTVVGQLAPQLVEVDDGGLAGAAVALVELVVGEAHRLGDVAVGGGAAELAGEPARDLGDLAGAAAGAPAEQIVLPQVVENRTPHPLAGEGHEGLGAAGVVALGGL